MSFSDPQFWTALGSIVVIDLLLAGDNAVIIAMAVRALPQQQKRKAILYGSLAAVLMRVALTFFVSQLLQVNYVKLVGGIVILWIAAKLFSGHGHAEAVGEKKAGSIWEAIKLILIADLTMSLDNMLAVGGASHGSLFLLLFGLAVSIPFVLFTSNLLSNLMARFPVILYGGAAVLGKVGAEMILTDPFVAQRFNVTKPMIIAAEVLFAALVVIYGVYATRRNRAAAAAAAPVVAPNA
jgi:YjbE family integral membrane protein